MITRFLTASAALALSAGMAQADYSLTILHTNDFHARFEPISKYDSGCSAEDDAEGKFRKEIFNEMCEYADGGVIAIDQIYKEELEKKLA